MATLNLNGARAIHKYNVQASTDVTGFGILGHAKYLSQVQKNNLLFHIDSLPVNKHL
jgi:selenide,water dikinase